MISRHEGSLVINKAWSDVQKIARNIEKNIWYLTHGQISKIVHLHVDNQTRLHVWNQIKKDFE